LPSADDCPECNSRNQGGRSYKKPRFNDEPRGPVVMGRRERTPVHDRLRGKVSMHDRLGGKVMLCDPSGGRVPARDRLEQMANEGI